MIYYILPICLLFLTLSAPIDAKDARGEVNNTTRAQVCSNQVLARPIDHGYTWTLTSRLGQLLNMAEEEYGERDKSWTLLGIEFTDAEQPRNWFPTYSNSNKNIIIQLTKKAALNKKEATFELSHEVFHLLMPTGKSNATYLEEGLATYFSIKATQKIGIDIEPSYIASPKYRKAFELAQTLYKAHPNAGEIITGFRKINIHPSSLNEKQLSIIFPKIDKATVIELAKRF